MKKKIILKIILIIFTLILSYLLFSNIFRNKEKDKDLKKIEDLEKKIVQSNTIKDVNYKAIDLNGNEYSIYAKEGEIDLSDKDIIILKNIESTIKLTDLSIIKIKSNYGKYNIINHDTNFYKNVYLIYKENKITGEYLEFSLQRNLMLISDNVIFSNLNNQIKADVVKMNLKNKDTKIFMYNKNELVKIISNY